MISFLHKIKSSLYGSMTLRRNAMFLFPTTLPLFMFCSDSLYLRYNIWHSAHFQSSLSVRHFSISFSNPIFVFPYPFFSFPILLSFFRISNLYRTIMNPVSTKEVASEVVSDVSRALLVHFVEAIEPTDFRAHFNISELQSKQFLN